MPSNICFRGLKFVVILLIRLSLGCFASRLEKKIEYLETSGLEAALTGTLAKLKSKLKGLHLILAQSSPPELVL
jgi:hypothetical protein